MVKHLLSKSSFIKGLQCEKHLYLYKYHYKEMDELSEMQKAIFQRGTDVGELAQQLFPRGFDASPPNAFQYNKCVTQTKTQIEQGTKVIYEAGFNFNDVLAIADIVVRDGDQWNIYEVKSSTSISETYLNDAALQYYVLSNSGIEIKDFSIIHINNQYIRKGELVLSEFFTIESVLDFILPRQDFVAENADRLRKVITDKKLPEIDIGEHCHNPYTCGFFNYCRKHIPENSVFELSGMRLTKKYDLYEAGIIKLDDLTTDYKMSKNNQIQLEVYKSGEPIIDKEAIENFISDLHYPLYFMDFESFQPAVPLFENTKPYQQIPFQYSIHYKKNENSELEHFEFLAEANDDPRIAFIENLLMHTAGEGDIIVYNKAFEITRLKEIAAAFPEFAETVDDLVLRVKDLMIPFRQKHYYAKEMKGSYSIKAVLPALVPELSYDDLEINEGGLATIAYDSLQTETDMIKISKIRKQLLEYCKLDTLAMVKILEKLKLTGE
jgi:hypothetical protein